MAAPFAIIEDVQRDYEGSLSNAELQRVQSRLDAMSARLRLLLPDLPDRIVAAQAEGSDDLAITARDVVVQAVIRRMQGTSQQVRAESEGIGPFSRTLTYTTDKSGTFPDEDLALLGGGIESTEPITMGTVHLGAPSYGYGW